LVQKVPSISAEWGFQASFVDIQALSNQRSPYVVKRSNIHERQIPLSIDRVGALIDTLASDDDILWPRCAWPAMRLDSPLGLGASGGHGPIRYIVEDYVPRRRVGFRIGRPPCLKGARHWFEVVDQGETGAVLRHVLEFEFFGRAWISWPIFWRPLHDACIDDVLARAQIALGIAPSIRPWSCWVRVLRFLVSGGRARPQSRLLLETAANGGEE
jgi:hypothetical protein